jgi:hypothetical protein
MKFRTQTVGVFHAYIRKSWAASALIFEDTRDDQAKRVVIEIDSPYDVAYIRERLNEIEAEWKRQLAELSNS